MASTSNKERLARREHASAILAIVTAKLVLALVIFAPKPLTASEVIRVVDGDSLIVKLNGSPQQVRLACIDAPEIGQFPYGRLATNVFRGLLPADSAVRINPIKKDRYGRTVGHVSTPGGVDVAEELVSR